jgi:hypothetical protein
MIQKFAMDDAQNRKHRDIVFLTDRLLQTQRKDV